MVNTVDKRYSPQELTDSARFHGNMMSDGSLGYADHQTLYAMLVQAASDAARVVELEKDAERMEFLESIREAYGFEDNHEGNRWLVEGPFRTLRQAIDTAMGERDE